MIPKRTKDTDIATEIAQGKHFKKRLLAGAEEAASSFMAGRSLSEGVAEVARREQFNRLQIQRLVEETNTLAFNKKYDTVRGVNDRRISFDLADLETVLELLGADAPPEVDNPNWMKGKPGDGVIDKVASERSFDPRIEQMRSNFMAKQAAREEEELYKEAKVLNKEIEGGLFKVANSLVLSHHYYQNGNVLFNTLLEKVAFDQTMLDGITKKAEEITSYLKSHNRLPERYALELTVAPHEKIASTVFGKHSLQKTASEYTETPKVAPIQNVQDFEDLISIAKKIQESQTAAKTVESKLHGGASQ